MATNVQILLPLLFVILVEGHYIDSYGLDIDEPDHKPSFWPKGPTEYNERYSYSSSDASMRRPTHYRSRNNDIYSYYSNGVYDSFRPYINYLNRLGNLNVDNKPRETNVWPNIRNKFDYPGQFSHNSFINDNDENPHEYTSENFQYSDENQEPEMAPLPLTLDPGNQNDDFKSLADSQNFQNISSKRNEEKFTNNSKEVSSKVNVDAEKDVFVVDNNGNNAYMPNQNVPSSSIPSNIQPVGNNAVNIPMTSNSNKPQQFDNQSQQAGGHPTGSTVYVSIVANIPSTAVPISNQPIPGNVVYVPVSTNNNDQQQPVNPVYQIVNGQQSSIPLTANRYNSIDNDRAMTNHVEGNPPQNNYSPIYIYANGQLILIPGYAVNPPPNIGYQELNTPGYYLNTNPPSQVNPASLPVTTTVAPISNDDLKTSPIVHNVQVVQNPSNTNNFEDYNMPDGNNYSNISPKKKDHIQNSLDEHPVGSITNPSTPSSSAWEIDNHANINQQPSSTKDRVEDEEEN